MMVWFFGTPIIYQLPERFKFVMQINPMTVFATFYRDIFYYVKYPENFYIPPLSIILICLGLTFFFFFLGYYVFKKLEPRFAEEI
jgi:ABC-type polysaccharide/polyol phosphate export permease